MNWKKTTFYLNQTTAYAQIGELSVITSLKYFTNIFLLLFTEEEITSQKFSNVPSKVNRLLLAIRVS